MSHELFGFLLVDAARLLRRAFESALAQAGLGLTPGEARALHHAANAGPIRQTLLAERMGVEPMTLVGYLDRLEAGGLIERITDPVDRRAKLVRPTASSEAVLERIRAIALSVRAQATRGLDDGMVDGMRTGLSTIRANLMDGGEPGGSDGAAISRPAVNP